MSASASGVGDDMDEREPIGALLADGIAEAVKRSSPRMSAQSVRSITDSDCKETVTFDLSHDGTKVVFMDYAPTVFARIREHFNVSSSAYHASLAEKPLEGGMTGAGKSGMLFFKSHDGLYIIKTVTSGELPFFLKCLRDYHDHLFNNQETLLPRFFGLYRIKLRKQTMSVIVMNNVFATGLQLHEKYDLKGSTHQREVSKEEQGLLISESGVLKDLNFKSQICLGPRKEELVAQVMCDTEFLKEHQMMDYSLLVGIHRNPTVTLVPLWYMERDIDVAEVARQEIEEEAQRLAQYQHAYTSTWQAHLGGIESHTKKDVYFLGIIDILQQYNVRKKLENAYKTKSAKDKNISAVESAAYGDRFVSFIDSIVT